MLLRLVAFALATVVPLAPSPVGAARDDTFCVRVSKPVRGSQLNKQVRAGRVTVRPVQAFECAPEPTPPGVFFDTVITQSSAITARLADVDRAIEDFNVEAMTLALAEVVERSSMQDEWLKGHQPMVCYMELHSEWGFMTSRLHKGAMELLNGTLQDDDRIMLEMRRPGLSIPARVFASSIPKLIGRAGDVFRECFDNE